MLVPDHASLTLRPYGANYPVSESLVETRSVRWRDVPSVAQLHPSRERGSGVVFFTRLWDPAESRSADDREWRSTINEFRIELVARLRASLGTEFSGGIATDEYSRHACPEELLIPGGHSAKGAYLLRVAQAEIVVVTAGLHRSLGWRFGEGLALGRPIVTEEFACLLPGGLQDGSHFAAFTNPEDAAETIRFLRSNPELLDTMRANVRDYYENWLRPDVLVARTILAAVESQPEAQPHSRG